MKNAQYSRSASKLAVAIGTAAVVLGTGFTCAFAQEPAKVAAGATAGVQDIVVTARRSAEKLQSVPVAITALNADALVKQNVTKASDLMTAVPGVFSSPGSNRGSNTPIFAVRGQVSRDPSLTNEPSIAIYFAEIPWANPAGSNSAFLDLQSVQVLKGPQGTLFGRNTTAGAILLTPNAPTDRLQGYVKAAGGTYGYLAGEGVLNLPIDDRLTLRIAGVRERRNGYMYNVSNRQRMDDLNDGAARASLKFEPKTGLSTTIIGTYSDSDTNGDAQRLLAIAPKSPSAAAAAAYARYPAVLAQLAGLGKYDQVSSFSDAVAGNLIHGVPQVLNTRQRYKASSWSIQDNTMAELGSSPIFGDVTFKNVIGYRHEADSNTYEAVPVPFLVVQNIEYTHTNQFTEEPQIQGKAGRLNYIFGLFYFHQTGGDLAYTYSFTPTLLILDAMVKKTSESAFAHLGYDIPWGSGLSLTAGFRYTHDRQTLFNANRTQSAPGPYSANILDFCNATPTPNVALPGSACNVRLDLSNSAPTWDVGLSYKIVPKSLVYASVSRGYRAGGYSEGARSAVTATTPFRPETVYNYEIGSKNDFTIGGAALRFDLAVYYSDYRNIQRTINFIGPTGTLLNLNVNAAKASIFGTEADLTFKPAPNLQATLSYSYVRPKYKQFIDRFRDPVSGIIYPVDVSDSEFVYVSHESVNASLSYTLPVASGWGIPVISASYYHRSSFFTTSDITTAHCTVPGDPTPGIIYTNCYNHAGRLPGYGVGNVRLDWHQVMGRPFDLSLFVNNVFDKYYYTNALNVLGSLGAISAQIGAPRMAGIELKVPFGK